jgi:hypothetical protein
MSENGITVMVIMYWLQKPWVESYSLHMSDW